MIATVIWKPFDAQFASIISAMDEHRTFIMDELEIYQARQIKDVEKTAAMERKRAQQERAKADESREKSRREAQQTDEVRKQLDEEIKGESHRRRAAFG
jgi:hypothetical protein